LVTPLGLTAGENVASLRTLGSAIGVLTAYELDERICRSAAQVAAFDVTGELRFPKSTKFMSRAVMCGMKAALDAYRAAGLKPGEVAPEELGIFAGTGNTCMEASYLIGPLAYAWADGRERDYKYLGGRASRMIDRYFSLRTLANAGVGLLSNELEAKGPNANYVHSETASLMAMENAWYDIAEGRCTVAVAGGYDCLVMPATHLDFQARGILSMTPAACAYRPFDRQRDGIVLGEGAAFLVLEERGHAERRGAAILGEIVAADCRMSSVGELAGHLADGREIDYVVARGFGTPEDDRTEYESLEGRLPRVPVTALKSRTGYLGAATGAAEVALGLMAAREGFVPAVARLGEADAECGLDLVKEDARPLNGRAPVGLFLSGSLAGQVGGIVVRTGEA
jgi:3-oxoacyl-(acyl-carrier-protein) synthase